MESDSASHLSASLFLIIGQLFQFPVPQEAFDPFQVIGQLTAAGLQPFPPPPPPPDDSDDNSDANDGDAATEENWDDLDDDGEDDGFSGKKQGSKQKKVSFGRPQAGKGLPPVAEEGADSRQGGRLVKTPASQGAGPSEKGSFQSDHR